MTVVARVRAHARTFVIVMLVTALAVTTLSGTSPRASATGPELNGTAFGIELCPQLVCGAATFIGYFGGSVDGQAGRGWWMITARHDDLPDAGATAALTGGRWRVSIAGGRTTGAVTGGRIHNNGDDTFAIVASLGTPSAGAADEVPLTFSGTLDHRTFPPTVRGTLSAAPVD